MDLASTHPAILAAIGALLLINTVVTVGLIKDVAATAFQKLAQGLVIWIIPFVGAGLILAFIGSHHSRKEMRSLVPFPFYLAAYKKPDWRESPNVDGSCGGAPEVSCGEGGCGD